MPGILVISFLGVLTLGFSTPVAGAVSQQARAVIDHNMSAN
jgi:hypothetical protein